MTDTPKTILNSAMRFFSGTMLSRLTGMFRDMALAYAFGTTSAIAALLVAFRFAHLLRRLLGEGPMQTALIPYFEGLRKESPERAGRFFCDLALSLSFLLVILIIVIMATLGGALTLIDLSEGNAEIIWLTLLMMPSLLFICLFGINASLLQCEKYYFIPGFAPVLFNLFWILGVAFSANLMPDKAMDVLALFIIIACLAQWAMTLPKTIQLLKSYGVTSFWKGAKKYSSDVLHLIKPLSLGIIGVAASQINNAFDAIFARWASEEGPAILWYAIRLQQLPLALFGIALSGALLPPLARAIKNNNSAQFRHFLEFALKRSLAIMIVITAGLFILGDSCISFIYGRGDFTSMSVIETTESLWGYTAGLLPMALVLVLAPAFYSKGDYRTPTIASVISMIINIVLNTIFIAVWHKGTASVAYATSISSWVNLLWLAVPLRQAQLLPSMRNLLYSAGKISIATLIACLAVIIAEKTVWGYSTALEIALGHSPIYNLTLTAQVAHLAVGGSAFLAALALSVYFLKVREITHFAKDT